MQLASFDYGKRIHFLCMSHPYVLYVFIPRYFPYVVRRRVLDLQRFFLFSLQVVPNIMLRNRS